MATDEQDGPRQWYGDAYLIGGVGIVADAYPIPMGLGRDGQEIAKLDIHKPELITGPEKTQLVRQRVTIEIRATRWTAEDSARDALLGVADVAALGALRPLRVVLASLADAPLDKPEEIKETLVNFKLKRDTLEPIRIDIGYVLAVWQEIGPLKMKSERKIRRALHWLRSAATAADDVEEFSALAFCAEAFAPLLPAPSAEWLEKVRTITADGSTAAEGSERLRYFATETLKVPDADWKPTWKKRNELCHGGLLESAEELAELRRAVTVLKPIVLAGLKSVLKIPEAAPPQIVVQRPIPQIQVSFSQYIPFMKPTE
jgi:hypothetical protein